MTLTRSVNMLIDATRAYLDPANKCEHSKEELEEAVETMVTHINYIMMLEKP